MLQVVAYNYYHRSQASPPQSYSHNFYGSLCRTATKQERGPFAHVLKINKVRFRHALARKSMLQMFILFLVVIALFLGLLFRIKELFPHFRNNTLVDEETLPCS